ncbi:MAG: polysaccharide pyruvyl transferase family protein [Clostridiales bacterium]|nr:polysaccharide pyruvyl transferase family protein [Clostridiales bacterium]
MKIELITLHRVTNFGSLLQTYATQTFLNKEGYDVEVIDFVPEGLSFKRAIFPKAKTSLLKKLIKILPLIIVNSVQYKMVNRFLKRHINLTQKRYKCYGDLLKEKPIADVYMTGSDQVWNTQNNNPPEDLKAYYLQFIGAENKKIAYAGSFGKIDFFEEEKLLIGKWLKDYNAISVREDSALTTLENLGIYNGVHVADPTLLLTAEDWKAFSKKEPPKEKYLFIYNLNRNKLLEKVAIEIAKQKNLKVINFADSLEFVKGAKNRLCNTPMDFLNYISNADFVVTDSFHGTAFSLNFKKQFISIPAPKYNSRLESILRKVNLIEKRYLNDFDACIKASNENIDYTEITPILDEFIEESKNFLRSALK